MIYRSIQDLALLLKDPQIETVFASSLEDQNLKRFIFRGTREKSSYFFLAVISGIRDVTARGFIPHVDALGFANVSTSHRREPYLRGRCSIGDKVLRTLRRNCFVLLCIELDKNAWLSRAYTKSITKIKRGKRSSCIEKKCSGAYTIIRRDVCIFLFKKQKKQNMVWYFI